MAQFETLAYQRRAIAAVVDCFREAGRTEPRVSAPAAEGIRQAGHIPGLLDDAIYANPALPDGATILANLQEIQRANGVPVSPCLRKDPDVGCGVCLDVEMETGTGKTYVYTRTMLELYRAYGWDHFILSVPTIAIRQGVLTSLRETEAHFRAELDAGIRVFAYDSANNDAIVKAFCAKPRAGEVHVLLLNAQKFNKIEQNVIHDEREMLGMLSAAQCIAKTCPVVILDEPQKQGGAKTLGGLKTFGPMVVLHYSATHAVHHELVYCLDAAEALREGLVKRIVVLPAETRQETAFAGVPFVRNLSYKDGRSWVARLEIASRAKRDGRLVTRTLRPALGENFGAYAGFVPGYDGLRFHSIDIRDGTVEIVSMSPGTGWEPSTRLKVGDAYGQGLENELRKAQILAAVTRHLETEAENFRKGIKTLTLFFIDVVDNYKGNGDARDGVYAQWLEEAYHKACCNKLSRLPEEDGEYRAYLERTIATQEALHQIHGGYFSSDNRHQDSEIERDYDVILDNKEALLRIDTADVTSERAFRFIFCHSALREGWDNPNVFTLCFLKDAPRRVGTVRQEIGRGLRLCVDQSGKRRREPKSLNRLAVITTQSFADFVAELQSDAACTCSRLTELLESLVVTADGQRLVDVAKKGTRKPTASILKYLETIGAVKDGRLTETFREMYQAKTLPLPPLSEPWTAYRDLIFTELAKIDPAPPQPENGAPEVKKTLRRREDLPMEQQELFRQVAKRISIAVRYSLDFDDDKIVDCAVYPFMERIKALGQTVSVRFTERIQSEDNPASFMSGNTQVHNVDRIQPMRQGRFDLVQDVMNRTGLSRQCVCKFLKKVWAHAEIRAYVATDYDCFVQLAACALSEAWRKSLHDPNAITYVRTCDPEHAMFEREQVLWMPTGEYDVSTLLPGDHPKHVYDILPVDTAQEQDGGTEGRFAKNAEREDAILLYAKIPDGFDFPTPFGRYIPDWVVLLRQDCHGQRFSKLFFVCETKGANKFSDGEEVVSTLNAVAKGKIACMKVLSALLEAKDGDTHLPSVSYAVLNASRDDGGIPELLQKAK